MNEMIELLLKHKSVRTFEPAEIPEEDVHTILQCAVNAATAGNMTLWSCIRVTDPQLKEELAEHCDHQPMIAKAPLVLVFYADYHRWMSAFETLDLGEPLRQPGDGDRTLATMDAIIAGSAAVTAAEALGYGACYIGDVIENWEWHREKFGLPAWVQPVCMAIIGVPNQAAKDRPKPARFKVEDVCFENHYPQDGAEKMLAMLKERQQKADDAEFDKWLLAFTRRKWNCDFSEEMCRSASKMVEEWKQGL